MMTSESNAKSLDQDLLLLNFSTLAFTVVTLPTDGTVRVRFVIGSVSLA